MKKIIKWIVMIIIILLLIGGGFFFFTKDKQEPTSSSSTEESRRTTATTDKDSNTNDKSSTKESHQQDNSEKSTSNKDGMVEPSADPQTEPMIEPSADPQTEPMIEPSANPQTEPGKNEWADTSTSIADKDNPLLNNDNVDNKELNDAANQATSTSPEVEANTDSKAKFQPSDWDYYEEGNYLILTRYKGKGEVPKLPKKYKGKQIDQSVLFNN